MGLKISITEEDVKAAEAPDYSPIPTGWYNFEIIDAEQTEFSETSKNPNKPYDKVSLRVLDGDYAGRRLWVNVPLFLRWSNEKKTPTNFVQFFQSVTDADGDLLYATEEDGNGKPVLPSEFEVPEAEELIQQRVTGRVRIADDRYRDEKEGLPAGTSKRNDVGSFRPYDPSDDPSPSKEDAPVEAAPAKGKAKTTKKQGGLDL